MKKIGTISVQTGELRPVKRKERTRIPGLSDEARQTIQRFRNARDQTAARAHSIRLG